MLARRLAVLLLSATTLPLAAATPRLVIADQDVVSSADMALMLLIQSPAAHLLGITTVTGDTWEPEETAHALRLLEALGRTDIPVVPGAAFPLVRTAPETRLDNQLFGKPFYLGAYTRPDTPAGWDSVDPKSLPEGLPSTKPSTEDAAHFLIRTVHAHPHQVTIFAAGPLTNVALACRLDPHFAELTEELVLMGGSLNPQTDAPEWIDSPRHEFNFWFDPEAASIVLRSAFPKITTTTIDVSLKTRAEPEVLDGLKSQHSPAAQLVTRYTPRPYIPNYLWDELAAAAWLDPSLITAERLVYMDVSTDHGPSYGDTLVYTDADKPAIPLHQVHAFTGVDLPRLQSTIVRLLSAPTPKPTPQPDTPQERAR